MTENENEVKKILIAAAEIMLAEYPTVDDSMKIINSIDDINTTKAAITCLLCGLLPSDVKKMLDAGISAEKMNEQMFEKLSENLAPRDIEVIQINEVEEALNKEKKSIER